MKRRSPGVECHAVFDIAVRSEAVLECGHVRAEDKLSALDSARHFDVDLALDLLILSFQVEKGYH
jgi:hypothetical protein